MNSYQLAQLNIAKLMEPLDSPRLSEFVANLDRINALADASAGFVWRPGDDDESNPFGDEFVANLSVWDALESLHEFVYRSAHIEVMRRRKDWFLRIDEAYTVLWWIRAGQTPSLAEASDKLEFLRKNGPSPEAFTFKCPYPTPGSANGLARAFDDECPAP